MFRNYLTVALRHLRRHKVYTLINVSGLAIGIAFCILTFLFVRNEWTYDAFHENADRIYRVYRVKHDWGSDQPQPVRIPMGPTLKDMFPDIEAFVRFTGGWDKHFRLDEKILSGIYYIADPEIFDVFDFPLKWGDPKTALNDLNSIVLSAEIAQKFFGDENPIGKVLTQATKDPEDFVVTGVFEPLPPNSSIQFDFLCSHKRDIKMHYSKYGGYVWNVFTSTATYLLLHQAVQADDLEGKFPLFVPSVREQMKETHADRGDFSLHLLPLTDMHLNTEVILGPVSNPKYSYILSGIALLVLFVACINFVNLSMGQSGMRAREVGVRKVVGATRAQLMKQFWGESILLSVFALGSGVALAELLLPTFNSLFNQKLDILYFSNATIPMFLTGLILFVGLAAGSLPALVLSRFQPVAVIKGRMRVGSMGWLRRGLVVVQFALSIFLVVSTVVMSGQLHYMRNKNLGFNPDQVISVDLWLMGNEGKQKAFRNAVLQHPAVLSTTSSNPWWHLHYWERHLGEFEDGRTLYGRKFDVDYDFLEAFEIELVAGRNFSPDHGSDLQTGMIVNEALVRQMGWDAPIGKPFPFEFRHIQKYNRQKVTIHNPEVIGVVKDFHLHALHHEIQPVALLLNPNGEGLLAARIRTDQTTEVLSFMRSRWKELEPNIPFPYSFIDEKIAAQYRDDERWGQIIRYAAGFAIFVACLGAFGLTTLAVARRTKEIGIRKVLGASEASLMGLFSREFVGLVVVANLIAWPVAYYAMDRWLQDFAYRIELGASGFLSGGLLTLLVVLLTVNLQTLKAVRANPVDALRYE